MLRPDGEAPKHSPAKKLGAVLYFMASSMLIQFSTKALFTTYGFHFPLTVALLQAAFTAPVAYLAARPPLSAALARQVAPLAAVNVANVVAGLVGTGGLNVPMFIALRRFTLLFTVALERLWLGKRHDRGTLAAMAVMVGGALVAAATDLSFSAPGYAAVLANDAMTSLYLVMVKALPGAGALTTTGMLFYNSALSLPMVAALAALRGEPAAALAHPQLGSPRFTATLFAASALGLSINHATFVCTRVNEPLMTSVAGNLKNVVMTVVGALAFPDFEFDPANAAGLALSMAGAVFYATRSALKVRARHRQDAALAAPGPVIGRERAAGLRRREDAAAATAAAAGGAAAGDVRSMSSLLLPELRMTPPRGGDDGGQGGG